MKLLTKEQLNNFYAFMVNMALQCKQVPEEHLESFTSNARDTLDGKHDNLFTGMTLQEIKLNKLDTKYFRDLSMTVKRIQRIHNDYVKERSKIKPIITTAMPNSMQ